MDIEGLLKQKEDQILDFKRMEIKPSDLIDLVVGFSNAIGGQIILGIADSKQLSGKDRILGVGEYLEKLSEIEKLISRDVVPNIVSYEKKILPIENCKKVNDNLTILRINKSTEIVSKINGDTFLRKGDKNVKIGAQEILKLKYERGDVSVESENSKINDFEYLDTNLLQQFKKDNSSQNADNLQFLKDQGLTVKQDEETFFTKGCLLLFGKNPTVALGMKCSIKISRYYGNLPNYTSKPNLAHKPISIEGPLVKQIEDTMKYFNDLRNSYSPVLGNRGFSSSYMIPESSFREAITNAVIHRNYEKQDDIHIRFFDNKIEIESPGTYPRDITPKNIRYERFCRNVKMQRILNRFADSPNLDIGEGVDRIFLDMQNSNLYPPLYIAPTLRPNTVLLVLFNENKIEYWDSISKYLDEHNSISNSDVRSITGLETLKASKLLKKFVDQGLLEKINLGNTKNTLYIKKDTPQVLFSVNQDKRTLKRKNPL